VLRSLRDDSGRDAPNNGSAGTVKVYAYGSGAPLGQCTIDQSDSSFGECSITLDPTQLASDVAKLYTDDDNPDCYLVYDVIELGVTY